METSISRGDGPGNELNKNSKGCLVGHLGIEYTRLTADRLEATMPADARTTQPFGLLHGGASVVLAEFLGSAAGYLCTRGEQQIVGIEVNANHLRAVYSGCAVNLGHTVNL